MVINSLGQKQLELLAKLNLFANSYPQSIFAYGGKGVTFFDFKYGGQQADINFEVKNISSNDIYYIQKKKTGSLIECCIK